MNTFSADDVVARYRKAVDRRIQWEALWRDCYAYALPQRENTATPYSTSAGRTATLFDGTAPDSVDQLAASLLGELTPPWGEWFALSAGSEASAEASADAGPALERVTGIVRRHFEHSNFAIEMHQCFLDLVTVGSACLMFEEASAGDASAFHFTAIPLTQIAFEESPNGRLDTTYRRSELDHKDLRARFPESQVADIGATSKSGTTESNVTDKFVVIEAVIPDGDGFEYTAVLEAGSGNNTGARRLADGWFPQSPFINFRWLKAPGEIYGRSPVMKALPDIKTANKVVELVLKNASIAVTGIWQAEDDGVLNPATVQLTPGTIIPKAVGSQGLTPLAAPGRFDISEIVLEDLRARIRKALLADSLGQMNAPSMTATEVLQRSAEMTRLLGATYGRLQSELMIPLIRRAMAILSRRGDIPPLDTDGRAIALNWRSPLARAYSRDEAQDALHWLDAVRGLGPEAMAEIDAGAMVRWLARAFDVPADLLKSPEDVAAATDGHAFANGVGTFIEAAENIPGEDLADMASGILDNFGNHMQSAPMDANTS